MKLDACVAIPMLFHTVMLTAFRWPSLSVSCYSDGSGSIDREEFLQIPQIANNPLAGRMIAIFDEECVPSSPLIDLIVLAYQVFICSGGGTVDFQEFVGGLSAFSSRGGRDEKLRCAPIRKNLLRFKSYDDCVVAFKVYDMDRDGYISNGELFLVLKMMVGNNLKVSQPLMCALVFSF